MPEKMKCSPCGAPTEYFRNPVGTQDDDWTEHVRYAPPSLTDPQKISAAVVDVDVVRADFEAETPVGDDSVED